jgi:arylformamidase
VRRRAFLAGAAAPLAARSALAEGPKVFRDYDEAALDAAYDQSKYAPNLRQLVRRYATNSELTRARLGAPRRVAYGSQPIERLDIYRSERANAPVQVFIHGGAWRAGLAKD